MKQIIFILPDKVLSQLMSSPHYLKLKDAKTLMLWDEARASASELGVIHYYKRVIERVQKLLLRDQYKKSELNVWNNVQIRARLEMERRRLNISEEIGRLVGNWVIHELGGHLTTRNLSWKENPIDSARMADLVFHVIAKKITGKLISFLNLPILSAKHNGRARTRVMT